VLAGSVKLVTKLGEGGMGSVWTAQHLALHTQVAVKFLSGHMAQDAAAAARFQREAMAAARIKSPHVVQIFDHGVSLELGPYIVMELLEGETLSAFVHRRGRLAPAHVARLLSQLCRARFRRRR
jgi:serine/threonine-protein kinase